MTGAPIDYLIVAVDYATYCHGTCPTCVLSREVRADSRPAITAARADAAFDDVAARYGRIGTLALGIGRANVLALAPDSVPEIAAISRHARERFSPQELVVEISTSLVGKIDPQIQRAETLRRTLAAQGDDARFVVVANTALSSPPYWRNLGLFLDAISAARGGAETDGTGDILQLALAIDSLPPVADLVGIVGRHRFPINLAWAPAFDPGAADEAGLARLGDWIARFCEATGALGIDSTILDRAERALRDAPSDVRGLAAHVAESARSVVYVAPDGTWHGGLFTALAEMDPVRFDPACATGTGRANVVSDPGREIARLMRNPGCRTCPHVGPCIASGSHRLGLIALRSHPKGTEACPSGMRSAFSTIAGSHRQKLQEHAA